MTLDRKRSEGAGRCVGQEHGADLPACSGACHCGRGGLRRCPGTGFLRRRPRQAAVEPNRLAISVPFQLNTTVVFGPDDGTGSPERAAGDTISLNETGT